MAATLGGLLKEYRILKKKSQFDVCSVVGWNETSRLSRIEQGKVKPTRDTLEKIMIALELDEIEKGEFLTAGDYLPTLQEVNSMKRNLKSFIDNWQYPALITDFTWRIVYYNNGADKLFKMYAFNGKKSELTIFDLMFEDYFIKGRFLNNGKLTWLEWVTAKIGHFKNEHHHQFHLPSFQKLLKRYMTNPEFKKVWNEVRSHTYKQMLDRYEELRILAKPNQDDSLIKFNIFTVPYIRDKRFDVVLFTSIN